MQRLGGLVQVVQAAHFNDLGELALAGDRHADNELGEQRLAGLAAGAQIVGARAPHLRVLQQRRAIIAAKVLANRDGRLDVRAQPEQKGEQVKEVEK